MKSTDNTEKFNLGQSVKHGFHRTHFHKTDNFPTTLHEYLYRISPILFKKWGKYG